MSIDGRRGLFHCFVCGAKGSVIDLVAAMDGITIQEAAAKLSYGLGDIDVSRNMATLRKAIRQVDRWREFANTPTAIGVPFHLTDLQEGYRGLSRKAISHYKLALCDKGVFIPHIGVTGNVVGYSIRQTNGVSPKYLNNPGFPKHIPFGLHQNKDEIIKRGFAIVCEGQFDSITLWDRGFMNVVSVMGSSLSDQQAHLLLGVTTKLLLLFDGDKAGIKGALKTHRRWKQVFDIEVKVLPNAMDPAEYMESSNV